MSNVINLDRPRQLKFGVLAARAFKKQFGESLIKVMHPAIGGDEKAGLAVVLDLDWATNILWAALIHEQKTLTVDRTADLLEAYLGNGGTLKELYERFSEAMNESARVWGVVAEDEGDTQGKEAAAPETTSQ